MIDHPLLFSTNFPSPFFPSFFLFFQDLAATTQICNTRLKYGTVTMPVPFIYRAPCKHFQDQKNEFISNSGTSTSCLAVFIRLPSPAFRAIKSLSSLIVFMSGAGGSSTPLGSGDARRVGGSVNKSMSMMIEDLRRMAGSSASILRTVVGLGGEIFCVGSWVSTDGRSNDHVLTRSNASAWHPVGGSEPDKQRRGRLGERALTHPYENPRYLKNKIEFCIA